MRRSLSNRPGAARGIAIVEVLVLLVLAGVLAALLIPGAQRQRRSAQLAEDVASLRQIAAWTTIYAADFGDRFWHFSWQAGTQPWDPADPFAAGLVVATGTGFDAQNAMHQAQMTYLMRRGIGDPTLPSMQMVAGFIPSGRYGHLPLLAHVGAAMPGRAFTSVSDPQRPWALDPQGFRGGAYSYQLRDPLEYRYAFSSGRSPAAAWWDRSPAGLRLYPLSNSGTFVHPSRQSVLGGASLVDVLFPSEKVMLHDRFAWHFGGFPLPTFVDGARSPLLFADGHVAVRRARESARGAEPNTGQPLVVWHAPFAWEPHLPAGVSELRGFARFLSTLGGVRGRDFVAGETPWAP